VGDGEKLLTHLNSALKVLLGLDIFPRVPKKKLNFVDQCNLCKWHVSVNNILPYVTSEACIAFPIISGFYRMQEVKMYGI